MIQILLMLKVLFTQDSEVEDLFYAASPGSEPSLFFSNNLFSLGFESVQHDCYEPGVTRKKRETSNKH